MANYFWRNVAMYAPRYKALVRVESMDFDPMVNRYFEAQFVESGENTNSSQSNGTNTGSDITSRENIIAGNSKEYPKTSMRVATEGETHTEGTDTNGPTTKNEAFNNVQDTAVHTGSTSDVGSTQASDTTGSTTSNYGSANNSATTAASTKAANKTAPMNASGDITVTTDSDGSKSITGLDFSYATGFSETDATSKSSGTSSNTATSTTSGTGQKTGSSSNTHTINTGDVNTKTGSITTTTAQAVNGSTSDGTNESVTITSYDTGSVIEKENTGSDTESINVTHNGTASTSQTDSGTHSRTSTNRYTGREGLTPQEGMMSATDYLMNYSVAFKWFVNKLDSCFIMLYDV